ncbi:MAG TPA: flagellar basal-body rod protein FlgF [Patescibacteria group bacterium]|nr:flagellar basal-body rod protein FlgF [Patescibacteria group bacterium]
MVKELYTAALGMVPQQAKLESVANNIANANTAGFKRESIFERSLINAQQNLSNAKGDVEMADLPLGAFTDFASGNLEKTGNPLDLALASDGFFRLEDEDGNEFLTRAGHFLLRPDGNVVTPDGKMLMSSGGPLVIQSSQPGQGPNMTSGESGSFSIKIAQNGEVIADGQVAGKIDVVTVENPDTLKREAGTCFTMSDETISETPEDGKVTIRQGYVEASNVNIIREMVEMIELQRAFELGQKTIHINDGTIDKSIEMGRVH